MSRDGITSPVSGDFRGGQAGGSITSRVVVLPGDGSGRFLSFGAVIRHRVTGRVTLIPGSERVEYHGVGVPSSPRGLRGSPPTVAPSMEPSSIDVLIEVVAAFPISLP